MELPLGLLPDSCVWQCITDNSFTLMFILHLLCMRNIYIKEKQSSHGSVCLN